jgi:uncharacterized protein
MSPFPELHTRALTSKECAAFLGRHRMGRLAFSFRDRVDIRPLGYVHREGWLFGRTSPGGKLETLLHQRWVAFQVDEIQDHWNWTSVVVHGAFHLLEEGATGESGEVRERALEALGEAFPEAFTGADPVRERDRIFGIAMQEVSGLEATLNGDTPSTGG